MRLRFSAALWSLVLLASAPAFALEPYLVKDINPIPGNMSSTPRELQALDNGIALFLADDIHDTELWRSDGTSAGTYRLTETCEESFCSENPVLPFALAGDRLYFLVGGGLRELWVTGGSAENTFQLTAPLQTSRGANLWIESLGLLFFLADDGEHGSELWRSDGTPAGTYRMAIFASQLTEFRGRLYFAGRDSRGPALWTSDGAPGGTKLVKDLVPGSRELGGPLGMLSIGSALVFFGPGRVLWRSDGTAKGTVQIFLVGQGTQGPVYLWESVAAGGHYYFTADLPGQGEELWGSDGTRAGTRRLTNFAPPQVFFYRDPDRRILFLPTLVAGPHLVFTVDDGVHGVEPWVTNGSPAGTRLLRDICPGSCSSDPQEGSTLGSRPVFTATTTAQGREPWVTDGTPAGTRIVRDICRGSCSSNPRDLIELNGQLIFAAWDNRYKFQLWKTDGSSRGTTRITTFPEEVSSVIRLGASIPGAVLYSARSQADGLELWRTDGTAAGTHLVHDINDLDLVGSRPGNLFTYRGNLFFLAEDGLHGRELWRSDGTDEGTMLVHDASATAPRPGEDSSVIAGHAEIGGLLLLLRSTPEGGGLWRTDGTETGTLRLTPTEMSFVGSWIRSTGTRVFFEASGPDGSRRLWTSDGTVEGTRLLEIQVARARFSGNDECVAFQGRLYFPAETPASSQRSLWSSDGTPEGTAPVPFLSSLPFATLLGVFGERLWFTSSAGLELGLWSTDGTEAGTALLRKIEPGPSFSLTTRLIPAGSRMFLLFSDELWVSDGTAAGTRKIGPGKDFHRELLHEGRLFYGADGGGDHFSEIWISDGTEAGTKLLLNAQGEPFGSPGEMVGFAGRVWFSQGRKIWQTDGTPSGTVETGLEGESLAPVGDRLFFSHWEPEIGWELWAVDPQ